MSKLSERDTEEVAQNAGRKNGGIPVALNRFRAPPFSLFLPFAGVGFLSHPQHDPDEQDGDDTGDDIRGSQQASSFP